MAWGWAKWRARAREEANLRRECRELKYVSAFARFTEWSDQEFLAFAERAQAARTALQLTIHAHDDGLSGW